MVDDDVAIVFNGEIYNYRQLRRELTTCKTDSDTEVLLQYYKKYGIEKTLKNMISCSHMTQNDCHTL